MIQDKDALCPVICLKSYNLDVRLNKGNLGFEAVKHIKEFIDIYL